MSFIVQVPREVLIRVHHRSHARNTTPDRINSPSNTAA